MTSQFVGLLLVVIANIYLVEAEGSCECNGFLYHNIEAGGTQVIGECKQEWHTCGGLGLWCYVDHLSPCPDAKRSTSGSPYRWSCEACDNMDSTRFETKPNTATTKPRIDPPPRKPSDADDDMSTGLVLALVLLFLGGLSWLLCCLWAVCRCLKTGPANVSEGGDKSIEERNLFLASSKQRNKESRKETYSWPISEEGPDYENTRQKSSVYDAMYEN